MNYGFQNKGINLYHCGGLQFQSKNTIIYGPHKSGKSNYIAKNMSKANLIYADDILAYSKKSHNFFGLGFPIRLRRPINKKLIKLIPKKFFIAGKNLAFLRKEYANIAPVEHEFFFDLCFEIKTYKIVEKIPFYKVHKFLNNYRIK